MYFINNPIILSYTPRHDVGDTFHRAIATVKVTYSSVSETFTQSVPVTSSAAVSFDISSTVRAFAERISYSAVSSSSSFTKLTVKVTFHEEWMSGGTISSNTKTTATSYYCLLGGFTDFERISGATASSAESASLTLRPASGLVIPKGQPYISLSVNTTSGTRTSTSSTIGDTPPTGVYAVPADPHAVSFQFVNTRGIIESACASCYASEAIKGGGNIHVRSLRESFASMSHRLRINDPYYAAFSFSSGYVDPAWARWWAFEFGKAKQHWVYLHSKWIPCSVEVKDGASIISHSKNELLHIDFDCIPDINGPI